jgi:ornithine cyclodeaminase
VRILTAAETRQCLPMADAIDAMEDAFGADRQLPQRQLIGSSFFMPGRVGTTSGIKVVSVVPGNPVGIVAVFDAEGSPVGIVDGPTLTAIRTAAGAGLATRILAPVASRRMAMLGAGAMARDQIAAVTLVRPIEEIVVWSRDHSRAKDLASEVGGTTAESADEAVDGADVITTATPSRSPLFSGRSLGSVGVHINAIGGYSPEMIEIPPDVVVKAFRVVDDRSAAAVEAGDLINAGVEPDAEVGDLLDSVWTRTHAITLFKSVGIASQDIAAAAAALANAQRLGIGTVV